MKIKTLICNLSLALTLIFGSCSGIEHSEAITADIVAAQMEGRDEAGKIVKREWTDTAELRTALLNAKVRQSKYIVEGKPDCAAAFDSVFISTIRTVKPDLANKIISQ